MHKCVGLLIIALGVLLANPSFADIAKGPDDTLVFGRYSLMETGFFNDLTVGKLRGADNGVGFVDRIGVNYAFPRFDPNPEWSVHAQLFLGGQVTEGPNQFGNGTIETGARYRLVNDAKQSFSVGIDLSWPFSSSEGSVGLSTPYFAGFFQNSWGFRPMAFYSYLVGQVTASVFAGVDLFLITNRLPPLNVAELYANYGGGLSYDLCENLRINLEAVAISWLTGSATHQAWVGPGLIWSVLGHHQIRASGQLSIFDPSNAVISPLVSLGWWVHF